MMKTIKLLFFFVLINLDSSAQCSIQVNVISSSTNAFILDRVEAVLFDDKLFETAIKFKNKFSTRVRHLEPGNYQIVYKNKYGEFSREEFKLENGQKKVNVNLKYDKLDSIFYSGKRKIDSLKSGDSLLIVFESTGCFHNHKRTIVFHRYKNELFATQTFDTLTETVSLDSSAILKIREFETELGLFHYGGCTTMDMYSLFFNGEQIGGYMDSSCSWGGYYHYIAPIFKDEEE